MTAADIAPASFEERTGEEQTGRRQRITQITGQVSPQHHQRRCEQPSRPLRPCGNERRGNDHRNHPKRSPSTRPSGPVRALRRVRTAVDDR
jgi:hypothetical protein